jgi:hypothetical protein
MVAKKVEPWENMTVEAMEISRVAQMVEKTAEDLVVLRAECLAA